MNKFLEGVSVETDLVVGDNVVCAASRSLESHVRLEVEVMLEGASDATVDDCPGSAVAFSIGEVLVRGIEASVVAFPADDDDDLWVVRRVAGGDGLAGGFDKREFFGVDVVELAVGDAVTEVVDFLRKYLLGVVCSVVLEAGGDEDIEVLDHLCV